MIQIHNAVVIKSGQELFTNFNWTIQSNEHWVISGANGSGKTILLEMLAGMHHTSRGCVEYSFIHGTDWDERFAQRKKYIHYISAHAIQSLIHQDDLFYQQRYYSMGDERTPLVRDLLRGSPPQQLNFPSSFSIEHLLNLEVTRLSNGQLKKVLILKKLLQGLPKVLLFDYPFEGLDNDSREDLIRFLDHLAYTYGVQLILVDHEHHLPHAINKRLILDNFKIRSIEPIVPKRFTPQSTQVNHPEQKTDEPIVEMVDLVIQYGKKEIIKGFNWKINKGERWALTGRNGSGKTTIFSLIYADHPMAYSQKVFLFGKRRGSGESIWDIKKRINYLGPELLTYMNPSSLTTSAYDYIIQQCKEIDRDELDKALKFFDAEHFILRSIRSLSSGQLQLTLIITSLFSDKELLLLDEPFQFLDPKQKELLNNYLNDHLHNETTLVLITHYEEDIQHWTNHRMRLQ